MKLKTATLIVIICQVFSLVYGQCFWIFHLYRHLGGGVRQALDLVAAVIGHGSVILFFIVLYSKQKGPSNE